MVDPDPYFCSNAVASALPSATVMVL